MKTRPLLIPFVCLSLAALSSADTFIMKDGTTLEGKVLSETADTYFVEVRVTKSIKDERNIPKADVKSIESEKLDETAFEKLKGLVPVPDLAGAEEYERRISTLTKFISEHPKSPRAADAEAMLSTIRTESASVSGGGIKLGGTLISPADYKANEYEIDAKIVETRVRDAASRGDYVSALRGIDRIDTDYRTTLSKSALIPLKKQVLQRYKAQITEQLSTVDARLAEQKAGLVRMSPEDRGNAERALAEEMAVFEKQYNAEKESRPTFSASNPLHKASLQAAMNAIESAITASEEAPPTVDGGKAYRNTLAKISSTDDTAVISERLNLLSEYEIPERYMNKLKKIAESKGVTF